MTGESAELSKHLLELLTRALDKVGETIFLMGDRSPRFIHVNDNAAQKLGYTLQELTGGMGVFDIDPDWTEASWDRFWADLAQRGTVVVETQHQTKDGHRFPVEITANYFEFGGREYNVAICRDITERKRTEAALLESEHLFRNLVENWPDEIARYDLDCRRVYVNPSMELSLGIFTPLLGKSPTETFPHSPEIAFFEKKLREAIESGKPAEFDMGWGAPAATPRYRALWLMPERDPKGNVTGVLAMAKNISEHKKAEDLLRISEEQLNEAQHIARIGSWVWRPDGSLDWSETMYEVFDVPLDVSPTIEVFVGTVHPDDRESVMERFGEWIQSERGSNQDEYRILWKDGSVRTVIAIGKKECDEYGNVTRAFGTCQDITERKTAEEKLVQADAKIVEILESITDAFVALDYDWRFTYVNTRAAQRAGIPREQMIGMKVEDVAPGHPSAETREKVSRGEQVTVETYIEPQDAWYESHIFPTRDGVSIYSRDITERKQTEIELARVNRSLRMLSDSNQALLFIDNQADLLQKLCEVAVAVGGYDRAWVGFLGEDAPQRIEPTASKGIDLSQVAASIRGQEAIAAAIRSGKGQFVSEMAALPLLAEGRPFGVFCVYSNEPSMFDENEVAILTELSGDLSFGLRAMQMRTKRERAEAAWRKQMRMNEAIFSQAITCFALFDRDYKFIQVNESFANHYGKSAEEFIGTSIFDVRPAGRTVEETKEYVDEIVRAKKPITHTAVPYEFSGRPERGITYWDSTLQPILDESGNVEFLFFSSIDVTERKRAELQLSTLTEHSPDAISRFDREGRYLYANSTIYAITGIPAQDFIGRLYGEFFVDKTSGFVPKEIVAMRKAISNVFVERSPQELELRLPLVDGDHDFNIRLIPEFDDRDEPVSVLCVARDITERKQAALALRNVLRHARTMVMHAVVTAPDGWDEHDPEWSAGRYHWESRLEDEATAQKVLPLEIPKGKQYSDAWHSAKILEDEGAMHLTAATAFVSEASSWRQEFRVVDRYGKIHWVTQAASVEPIERGRWRVTTINTDITDRKLAEEQVRSNMVRMQMQESALIALTKKEILEGGDVAASLRRLTEASARALGVERVSLWRYQPGLKVMECVDLFELSKNQHSSGMTLAEEEYPAYFKGLATCDVIAAENAQRHPQTQEFAEHYLEPLGISSMLDVPIQLNGALEGVLCHEHTGPKRKWTSDERTFAIAMANFVTLVLEEHERQRAQEELSASQQAYASLVNSVDGIVWELDVATFGFTFVSKQAERLLGYPTDLWIADTDFWANHLHPEDRNWALDYCITATQEMRDHDFQYRMIAADGGIVWLHDLVTVVVENGRPVKLRGIMVDITDRKLAEQERENLEAKLRQAQKIEALGTLAGGIAHDFNNILGAILGNVELAIQDSRGQPALIASLEQIRKAGHRARDLTQQILLFGRQQVAERRVISLASVVDQCVSLLKATLPARVTVRGSVARNAQPVLADASQMLQVLVNLGTNAAHAMQDQPGTIDIRVEAVTVDKKQARSHPDLAPGRYVRISVSDTGRGMDTATQLRIFEPFFTTKQVGEGTGLGLSVVHGIVSSHGGVIIVHSKPGVGSTFELYLPAVEAAVEDADDGQERKAETKGKGQHILCIDDDEPLVFLLKRMLERQGYRVSGYTNIPEALEVLRANPQQFDAIVTDYNMPGMSGLEVARIAREIRPDLPIAVASGFITDELKTQAVTVGVTDLIFKPNAVDEYCEVVARLVDR